MLANAMAELEVLMEHCAECEGNGLGVVLECNRDGIEWNRMDVAP
jgi:hypothetical protein